LELDLPELIPPPGLPSLSPVGCRVAQEMFAVECGVYLDRAEAWGGVVDREDVGNAIASGQP